MQSWEDNAFGYNHFQQKKSQMERELEGAKIITSGFKKKGLPRWGIIQGSKGWFWDDRIRIAKGHAWCWFNGQRKG